MSSIVRKGVRFLLRAKKSETVKDACNRHWVRLQRWIHHEPFDSVSLEKTLRAVGLGAGDTVMVHASWRQFYNYLGTPEDVIALLQRIIGPTGTLLMPCYGASREFFDVDKTPSHAGVLSEIFRRQPGVIRSKCTHFSVAAWGKNAASLVAQAQESRYGFDEKSPYYKLTQLKEAKLLFLGLGKEPVKVSMLHCASYAMRHTDTKLAHLISKKYESVLVCDGVSHTQKMVIRCPGHANDPKGFKQVVRSVQHKRQARLSNLDIVQLNAQETFQRACDFISQQKYFYKNMEKL